MFDAAIEGVGAYAKYAYFFVGQSYLSYDWTAGSNGNGRVANRGPRPLSEWNLPAPFDTGITGALNGAGNYAGKAYFFKGPSYVEYGWGSNTAAGPFPMSAWPLPMPYAGGFDDAWSGEGSRAAYGYFLHDARYLRYRWAANGNGASISSGYPKPFAERKVAGITRGVDACLNGRFTYQGKAYFFDSDDYARLDWGTLYGDSQRVEVFRNWPGLAELAAVEPARRLALQWVDGARARLAVLGSGWPPADPVIADALRTHFHITSAALASQHLPTVRTRFDQLGHRLRNLHEVLVFRTPPEVELDRPPERDPNAWRLSMAYTSAGGDMRITEHFVEIQYPDGTVARSGPRYRATMLQHETGHQIGMADHAYEWQHPDYELLAPERAVQNTSSYVMFAKHLDAGHDVSGDPDNN